MNWNSIQDKVSSIYRTYHSKDASFSTKERLDGIVKGMETLITIVSADEESARSYVSRRTEQNQKLGRIQTQIQQQVSGFLGMKAIPASSFSAGTNLIGESDLDFNVPVMNGEEEKMIRLANLCGENGYHFLEIRSKGRAGQHAVFQKWVDDLDIKVEIEVKLQFDGEYYLRVFIPLHHYLDHVMNDKDRTMITWMKYNLKILSKDGYATFKGLYYEYALAKSGGTQLLYPLH
jgi:hypothetical protein